MYGEKKCNDIHQERPGNEILAFVLYINLFIIPKMSFTLELTLFRHQKD